MPIYEYRCEPCEDRFEAFIASSEDTPECPKCGGRQLTKLMSTFAAVVPGGYKASQAAASAAPAPKPGGHTHGGGCGCH